MTSNGSRDSNSPRASYYAMRVTLTAYYSAGLTIRMCSPHTSRINYLLPLARLTASLLLLDPRAMVKMGMARLQSYMTSHGLEVSDIPKALVLHEILGFCMLAITWTFCYYFPLSKIPFFEAQLKRLPPMHSFSKSATMTRVFDALSSRRGVAYLESSCLRKVIRPATIPGKMWVVFLVLRSLKSESDGYPADPVLWEPSEDKAATRPVAHSHRHSTLHRYF